MVLEVFYSYGNCIVSFKTFWKPAICQLEGKTAHHFERANNVLLKGLQQQFRPLALCMGRQCGLGVHASNSNVVLVMQVTAASQLPSQLNKPQCGKHPSD